MATSRQHRSFCCFKEWMEIQEQDLNELIQSLSNLNTNTDHVTTTTYTELAQKSINHFQDYINKRSQMSHEDVVAFFTPTWCTSLENYTLWIAGCRPSLFIRLVYALSGSHVESLIADLMQQQQGATTRSSSREKLCGQSARQLTMINNLHMKTIKEEDKMTSRLASLQENMADQQISVVADVLSRVGDQPSEKVDQELDEHQKAMADIMQEADKLRLSTLKVLVNDILSPVQAVDFLAASKKLHLCIHECGKKRDQKQGRN